ncbi:MAG: RNA polymerase subunit sigma, partial [Clostridia bacterium]|nr:RNA polymerase subunit sigma [Clostridia bacterium]
KYGISFFDLPKTCPKARKTRHTCLKAARFVAFARALLLRLRRTLKLPAAEMETGVPISRKLLDQFRKYIITCVEIEAGDFPSLRGYLVGKGEEA